jgi:large subunit ribosomal protein LP0
MPSKASLEKKELVWKKIHDNLNKYKNVMVCQIKDLPANIVHKIRKLLRGINSEAVCGKSTVMSKSLVAYAEETKKLPPHFTKEILKELSTKLAGLQNMLIFTNNSLDEVTKITNQFIIEKQAKPGQLSPIEVLIPAGPTGMDANQIEYFQALKIPTKVSRGQLEITATTKILTIGQKISLSEINLMKKFNIKPYKHMVQLKFILLNGKLYDEGILKITPEYMKAKLEQGFKNVLQFSLAAGVPTQATAPLLVAKAFRNVIGLSLATNVLIEQTKNLTAAPPKEQPKKEEKKEVKKEKEPEPEEEEEDMDLGGLF